VQAVEQYLHAFVDKKEAQMASLVCGNWEAEALLEYDSFQAVAARLEGLDCSLGAAGEATAIVRCRGRIMATYGNEDQAFPLDERAYRVMRAGGDWLVCGYETESRAAGEEAALAAPGSANTPAAKSGLASPTTPAVRSPTPTTARTTTLPAVGSLTTQDMATPTPGVRTQTTTPSAVTTPSLLAAGAETEEASAEEWKSRPVLPGGVSDAVRAVYLQGLAQGNHADAFSVFGDCQSLPEVFMGPYETDPALVKALPPPLRETVAHFHGSFNRYSPTVKDGTTEGALLWGAWNDNKDKKCQPGETPVDCELRVHRPSIVLIHVGTHWEARNRRYLTLVIEKVLAHGAVPVMVTKADNRELDERVNSTIVALADEYNLPLWNFWAAAQPLPNAGMEENSDMYLNEAGVLVHRETGLTTLDILWRALRAEQR
jgi:hypothetical protein